MTLAWIASRLKMGTWTYVSNLLCEDAQRRKPVSIVRTDRVDASSFVRGGTANYYGLLRRVSRVGYGAKSTYGQFAAGVSGIAGVAFQEGGQTHYGWIRLRVDDGAKGFPVSVTAIDWEYETTPNTPIHVPEANPALALLAAGGTGLVAWRVRRRNPTGTDRTDAFARFRCHAGIRLSESLPGCTPSRRESDLQIARILPLRACYRRFTHNREP
jgi:hypothetical protein